MPYSRPAAQSCTFVSEQSVAAQYIYISLDEIKAVAAYIKSCGRVSISQLAAKSSALIDLEARAAPPEPLDELTAEA